MAVLQDAKTGVDSRSPQPLVLDTRAWIIWLVALVAVALMTRNPLYQILLGGWIILTWSEPPVNGFSLRGIVWFGAIALIFGTSFNALTVHVGNTVLWTIPGDIPLVSGVVTLEAAAYGASNGLTITLLVLIFARFSAAIDYAGLLRIMPTALFEMGLLVSISFTLMPNMRQAWFDIQQTQALRGHRIKRLRDLPPLIVPVVVNGLERALTLAEAMEARGYAHRKKHTVAPYAKFLLSLSLLGLLFLFVIRTFVPVARTLFITVLILCGVLLWFGLKHQPVHRTCFRQNYWSWRETIIAITSLSMLIVFVATPAQNLNFSPYPLLKMPVFNPWLGLVTMAVVLPALFDHD